MDIIEAIQIRRSVRKFLAGEIEEEKLKTVLQVATHGPSAGNLQPWQTRVIRDTETKQALAEAAQGHGFLADAPIVLVFCIQPARSAERFGARGAELFCIQDTAVAVAYAQLAATAVGLASCWVGDFDEQKVTRALKLLNGDRPVTILPIGYSAAAVAPNPRMTMNDVTKRQ
jgi:nitroreductase